MDVGRKKRIKRDWSAVFVEFHGSGLSVKEFCRTNGIAPSLFYLRRKDYSDSAIPAKRPLRRGDFIELASGSSSQRSASIVFPGQIELSISNDCDKDLLRLLISELKGLSC